MKCKKSENWSRNRVNIRDHTVFLFSNWPYSAALNKCIVKLKYGKNKEKDPINVTNVHQIFVRYPTLIDIRILTQVFNV